MATYFSILAWEIPWTEEPGGQTTVKGVSKSWTRQSMHVCKVPQTGDLKTTEFFFCYVLEVRSMKSMSRAVLLLKSAGEEVSLTLPAPGVADSPWASLDSDASLQSLPLSSHGLLSSCVCVYGYVCVCVWVCVCVCVITWPSLSESPSAFLLRTPVMLH